MVTGRLGISDVGVVVRGGVTGYGVGDGKSGALIDGVDGSNTVAVVDAGDDYGTGVVVDVGGVAVVGMGEVL